VRADDFADLAPASWRADGPPQLLLFSGSLGRVFRFNRVEGLYVGVAPTLALRSAAPGLSVGAYGGWTFTEQTARGGAYASWKHGAQTFGFAQSAPSRRRTTRNPPRRRPRIRGFLSSR
jgi:hypothetical protein